MLFSCTFFFGLKGWFYCFRNWNRKTKLEKMTHGKKMIFIFHRFGHFLEIFQSLANFQLLTVLGCDSSCSFFLHRRILPYHLTGRDLGSHNSQMAQNRKPVFFCLNWRTIHSVMEGRVINRSVVYFQGRQGHALPFLFHAHVWETSKFGCFKAIEAFRPPRIKRLDKELPSGIIL